MTLDRVYKIAAIVASVASVIVVAIVALAWVISMKSDVDRLQSDVGQLQNDVGQLQNDVSQLRIDVAQIRAILERGDNSVGAQDTNADAADEMRVVPRQHDKGISFVWQQEPPIGVGLPQVGSEDTSE